MSATHPTPEQLAALLAFAAANGRTWKSKLLLSWESCDTHGEWTAPLRQVRNTFGPSWLLLFKLPAVAAEAAVSSLPGHERPLDWFEGAARRGFTDEGAI